MRFYQYYTTLSANLLSLGYGQYLGWASPGIPLLMSDETPLPSGPITAEQVSVIISIVALGNILGTLGAGVIVEKYGRKLAAYICAIPLVMFWILLIFAENAAYIYAARIIGGLGGGGIFLVIPIYISEIAEVPIRGHLGAFLQLNIYLGIVIGYIWGVYLTYHQNALISLIFPIAFMILFWIVPESPEFLISRNRIDDAIESLKFFRGFRYDKTLNMTDEVAAELKEMERVAIESSHKFSDLTRSDFTTKPAIRGISMSIISLVMTQACGNVVMTNYTATFFKQAGSTFSPNTSSIIAGVLQFLAAIISPALVERAGRRTLISASSLATGICLLIFGLYSFLKEKTNVDVSTFTWVPLMGIAGVLVNSAWGLVSLPLVVITEIVPFKIRGIMIIVGRLSLGIAGFILLKYYFDMVETLGMFGTLWLYASCCFAYSVYVFLCLPETKGLTVDQIIKLLE